MKVQVSNTNTPNWRDITVKSQVPTDLKCLEILAKNLWWSWNNEAINLSNRSIKIYGNRFMKTPFYSYNALATKSSKK